MLQCGDLLDTKQTTFSASCDYVTQRLRLWAIQMGSHHVTIGLRQSLVNLLSMKCCEKVAGYFDVIFLNHEWTRMNSNKIILSDLWIFSSS